MRTTFEDDGSEFDPLAGKRLVITEPLALCEGDWVEARGSSIESMMLSSRADESEIRLVDGQSFTFYADEKLIVYRRQP